MEVLFFVILNFVSGPLLPGCFWNLQAIARLTDFDVTIRVIRAAVS